MIDNKNSDKRNNIMIGAKTISQSARSVDGSVFFRLADALRLTAAHHNSYGHPALPPC